MNLYFETELGKLYKGHVLETLKALPSDTVSCCITSPPYWALRDYGTDGVVWGGDADCEHKWGLETKPAGYRSNENRNTLGLASPAIQNRDNWQTSNFCDKCGAWKGQLGLEPDFNLYIKHLCDIFDEVKRVLRKDGTCWVNLGDTYHNADKWTNKEECPHTISGGNNRNYTTMRRNNQGLPNKSLCNIPSRFSIEMQNRGWILRNKIIWHKPNCMPSSVTDRFTVDFEEIFFFVKNKKYWFEQQTEELSEATIKRVFANDNLEKRKEFGQISQKAISNEKAKEWNERIKKEIERGNSPKGRNMRTVWKIPTQPFPGAHFAVFPEKLVETPIRAGCPKEICTKCGKPREKIMEYTGRDLPKGGGSCIKYGLEESGLNLSPTSSLLTKTVKEKVEIGYTKCDCNAPFVAGIVLDPFMGSGTTAVFCEKNHYQWLGCDVSDKYCEMIKGRLEPYKMQKRLI